MAKIKALSDIGRKFAEVTPQRAAEYEAGVRQPQKDWAANTANAEANYKEGVTRAATAGRFGAGVKKAGTAKWQKAAIEKGTVRFGPGVAMAQGDYEAGFEPYHRGIQSLTLPARYPRRDPRNLARVAAVAKALGDIKEARSK